MSAVSMTALALGKIEHWSELVACPPWEDTLPSLGLKKFGFSAGGDGVEKTTGKFANIGKFEGFSSEPALFVVQITVKITAAPRRKSR